MALALILALAVPPVMLFGHPAALALRLGRPGFAVELAATLLTGVAGVVAAFHLALPDRSRLWALLPAAPALVWLSSSLGFGGSAQGFACIAMTSLPIGGVLLWLLARARSLRPGLTGAAGGLAAAALGALVLECFRPDLWP